MCLGNVSTNECLNLFITRPVNGEVLPYANPYASLRGGYVILHSKFHIKGLCSERVPGLHLLRLFIAVLACFKIMILGNGASHCGFHLCGTYAKLTPTLRPHTQNYARHFSGKKTTQLSAMPSIGSDTILYCHLNSSIRLAHNCLNCSCINA